MLDFEELCRIEIRPLHTMHPYEIPQLTLVYTLIAEYMKLYSEVQYETNRSKQTRKIVNTVTMIRLFIVQK